MGLIFIYTRTHTQTNIILTVAEEEFYNSCCNKTPMTADEDDTKIAYLIFMLSIRK